MERNRKDVLLKIGERLFTQHGYRDISIKDITSAAGMGMGNFYTYFDSKEAFYTEILDVLEQRGVQEMEKRVNGFHAPLIRLKTLFRYTILSLRSNEILRGIYTGEKRFLYPGAEERMNTSNSLFKKVETLLEEILADGARQGVFRTSLFHDPKRMVYAIFTTIPLSVRGPNAQDLIDDMMVLMERGLKRWLRFRQREERLEARARRRVASR